MIKVRGKPGRKFVIVTGDGAPYELPRLLSKWCDPRDPFDYVDRSDLTAHRDFARYLAAIKAGRASMHRSKDLAGGRLAQGPHAYFARVLDAYVGADGFLHVRWERERAA